MRQNIVIFIRIQNRNNCLRHRYILIVYLNQFFFLNRQNYQTGLLKYQTGLRKYFINNQSSDDSEYLKWCLVRYLNPADYHPARI